jgi:predicted peptidase
LLEFGLQGKLFIFVINQKLSDTVMRMLIIALLCAPGVCLWAQVEAAYEFRLFVGSAGDTLPYRILFPLDYDPGRAYPLLLFLHGGGERGDDNVAQLKHGAWLFADSTRRRSFPAIVVFPQCSAQDRWSYAERGAGASVWDFAFHDQPRRSMRLVMELLDGLQAEEGVDADRLYVTGLSMGGFGTLELLARWPDRFAAAVPICGGGHPGLAALYAPYTPIWLFHGALDNVVPPQLSRDIYRRLRRLGANVRYTEYPLADHNSWDSAFVEPGLLPWLFSQSRGLARQEAIYQRPVFDSVGVYTYLYAAKEGQPLAIDVYLPNDEETTRRPVLLFMHGGGFSGGRRDDPSQVAFATDLASRGFVVASMSYRLTMRGQSFGCDQPAANKLLTFRKAVEDIRDAVNWLLSNAAAWSIDSAKVVLIGSSAGAEAILHAAYWQDEHLLPDSPKLPRGFRFAGLISLAGAIVDTALIRAENAVPTQFFHGVCDNLVPYGAGPHHYCPETAPGFLPLYGARSMAERLARLGKPYYLVTSCEGAHEWAGRPLVDQIEPMVDFLYHEVLGGRFRQLRARHAGPGACQSYEAPEECR